MFIIFKIMFSLRSNGFCKKYNAIKNDFTNSSLFFKFKKVLKIDIFKYMIFLLNAKV
jgi:hypothetical protein